MSQHTSIKIQAERCILIICTYLVNFYWCVALSLRRPAGLGITVCRNHTTVPLYSN